MTSSPTVRRCRVYSWREASQAGNRSGPLPLFASSRGQHRCNAFKVLGNRCGHGFLHAVAGQEYSITYSKHTQSSKHAKRNPTALTARLQATRRCAFSTMHAVAIASDHRREATVAARPKRRHSATLRPPGTCGSAKSLRKRMRSRKAVRAFHLRKIVSVPPPHTPSAWTSADALPTAVLTALGTFG
jgi:hypothetical protein